MAELKVKSGTAADGTFSTSGATAWDAGMSPVAGTVLSETFGGTGLSALGTGVATALAINVGSAGAFLTSNAAPSYPVTVAGTVTSGGIPYFSSTTVESSSGLLAQNGVVLGGGAGAAPSTSTNLTFNGSTLALAGSQTVTGVIKTADGTAAACSYASSAQPASGMYFNGNDVLFSRANTNQLALIGGGNSFGVGALFFGASAAGFDSGLMRAGVANSLIFANQVTGAGNVTSRTEINKNVTAIANNTATATLTVTIPNGNHSAGGKITFKGAAGAGGAIGVDEFTALVEYDWIVTRTTGANAVATLSAALLTSITASVVSGATPTISAALSAISGGVSAVNTFTFNVTINALTGSSTNHTCFCYAILQNDNTSGVTIA